MGCPNAAGTMFRLCVDLATQALLPGEDAPSQPNSKQCRDIGLRLPWLFEHGLLQEDLHELSRCIKEDGNDGAHRGTLTAHDAEELQDFARMLLERLYTTPARIAQAKKRREERRNGSAA